MKWGQRMSEPSQMGLLPGYDQPPAASLTQEQGYAAYISSPAWRRLRLAALEAAGNQCQRCGVSKWSAALEVHHLTYERFKHERLSDLVVLCEDCHKSADIERAQEVQQKNYQALERARFDGWASKVYGAEWADHVDSELVSMQYEAWRERKASE